MRPGNMDDASDIARKAATPKVEVAKPLSKRPTRQGELAKRPDAVVRRLTAIEAVQTNGIVGSKAPVSRDMAKRGTNFQDPRAHLARRDTDLQSAPKLSRGPVHRGPEAASALPIKNLPPTASPKAREKFEEVMKKIVAKRQEKSEKRQKQLTKWSSRPKVLKRWESQDEHQRQRLAAMAARQEAAARKDEEKRAAILARPAATPQAEEARKKQLETLDRQIAERRIRDAGERARAEEAHARNIAKREKWQRTKDKVFNAFGRFLGWEKREIPTLDGWFGNYRGPAVRNYGSYEYLGNGFQGQRLGSFEPE